MRRNAWVPSRSAGPAAFLVVIASLTAGSCGGSTESGPSGATTVSQPSGSTSQPTSIAPSPTAADRVCLGIEVVNDKAPRDAIIGTDGDDRLVGTPGRDFICGNGGNDVIDGRGGRDKIYGGPGDDDIRGGVHVFGGPGDDHIVAGGLVKGGPGDDLLKAAGSADLNPRSRENDHLHGEDGDDVLLAPRAGPAPWLEAGAGNDLMVGALVTIGGNSINGGDGKDVAVALNLSSGLSANADRIDLDGKRQLTIGPGSACTVTAPPEGSAASRRAGGKATCKLPWPQQLSELDEILPLSITLDREGKLTLDADLHEALRKLTAPQWRDLTRSQASIPGDTCVCDPLVPLGQPPPKGFAPLDWSM